MSSLNYYQTLKRRLHLPDGRDVKVRDVAWYDFCDWLDSTLDAAHEHTVDKNQQAIDKAHRRYRHTEIEENTVLYWTVINELLEMPAFQASGVALFVENEKVSA